MGRAPCCTKIGLHRGPWTSREDTLLTNYIHSHGEGNWRALPKKAGLLRCGKSCRLRWMNYLRPGIKRGNITPDEEDLIIRMHSLLGNRWSLIAGRLPGRTDNEIKNYWNTHLIKRLRTQANNLHGKPLSKRMVKMKKDNTSKANRGHDVKLYVPKAVRVKTTIMSSLNSDVTLERTHNIGGSYYNLNDIDGGGDCDLDIDLVNGFDFEFDFGVPALAKSSMENVYQEYLQLVNNFNVDEEFVSLDSFESLFM